MLLSTKTLEGLNKSGFFKPSPVQLHGIPMGKCGFDLLLEAKSGTGKTAVFTVIALEKIDLNLGLQVVILSPTREIAAQICDVIKQIGSEYAGLCVEVVMGGLPVQDDIDKFSKNKVHIVVGSPGRLKHLMQDQHIDTSAVRLFVLDEADKLMEKSFLTDIKCINSNLPQQKQVIMSSATYPESCKEFLNQFVHGAQHICPESNSVLLGVSQKVTHVKYNSNIVKQTKFRYEELIKILSNLPFKQCLIFCNYQARVSELHRMLKKADWPVEMLHGQQDQNDRLGALKTLQEYKCRILISTDLASRGIDASNIDVVINFEPPFEWQTYLHRIGRAGRFGSYGTAITIVSEGNEHKKFIALLKTLNSSVILSSFCDGNNIVNGEDSRKLEEKDTLAECPNLSSESENINKTVEKTIPEKNLDKIKEYYSLFFTESQPQEEIESFADLLLSYEEFNPTDTQVKSPCYACIELPTISHDEVVFLPGVIPSSTDDEAASIKEATVGISTEVNKTNLQNINKDDFNSEIIYDNEDFIKLGLPTQFSSSKTRKMNYDSEKAEINNNDNHNIFRKGYHNSNSGHSNKQKQKDLECGDIQFEIFNNSKGETKKILKKGIPTDEIFNKNPEPDTSENSKNHRHRIKNEQGKTNHNNRKENKAVNYTDICSNIDHSSCNSYVMWYKQLKLRTKQIELALYINELSSIQ